MNSHAGYRPWSQSFMLYLSRSWIATAIIAGSYVGLLGSYFLAEAPVVILFTVLFIVITVVSARLKALQAYSLSYMAPGYKRFQLFTGLGLLFLLGWLPLLFEFKSNMTMLQAFSVLFAGTGVGLLGDYKMPRVIGFSITAVTVFCLSLFLLNVRLSWDPAPMHSSFLILLGLVMIVVYSRLIVAGKDYDQDFGLANAGAPAGGFWLKDFRQALRMPHSQRKLSGGKIENAVVRFQSSDSSFLDLARLLNVSVGDWAYWRGVQVAIFFFCVTLITLAIILNRPGFSELLPYLLVLTIFNVQIICAMAYVTQLNWPLRSIWINSPLTTKEAHLKAMTIVAAFNVLYHYIQAAAVSLLIFWAADTFEFAGIYFIIALAANIQAIAFGLIFVRYKHAAFVLQFVAVVGWLTAVGWLSHPFFENLWTFSLLSLSTAIVTLVPTLIWWLSGFFTRNEHSLDY